MKRRNWSSLLIIISAVLLSLMILPNAAQAAEEQLSDYVNLEEFSQQIREQFFLNNENPESTFLLARLSEFSIPATEALYKQLKRQILYAIPELALCYEYDLTVNNGCYSGLHLDIVRSTNKTFYEVQRIAAPLLEGIQGNDALTEAEKALLLHDRLALWTDYSFSATAEYPGIGAFLHRADSDDGYANAYRYLLASVGIYSEPCKSSLLNRTWNIVYIDGKPYHTDVLQDDTATIYNVEQQTTGYVAHWNFLRSTDGIVSTGHVYDIYVDYNTDPSDTTYDNYYWQSSNAAFQLIDNTLYYLDSTDGTIYEVTHEARCVASFAHSNTTLATCGNKLLYNIASSIYCFDLQTGATDLVLDIDPAHTGNIIILGLQYEKSHIVYEYINQEGVYKRHKQRYFYGLPGEPGWRTDAYGRWYCNEDGTMRTDCWMQDENDWCYLGSDGYVLYDQWCNGKYVDRNGYLAREQWVLDDIGWQWLDMNSEPVKDHWLQDQFGLFYLDETGYKVTSTWLHDGTGWRWLNYHGRSATNEWHKEGDCSYYLDEQGYMVTGRKQIGYLLYWFDDSGVAAMDGWFWDGIGWFYAHTSGAIFSNQWICYDGKTYTYCNIPSSPESDSNLYYYLNEQHYMAQGRQQIGEDWYWFADSGVLQCSTWVLDSTGWCYINNRGKLLVSNWIYDNGTDLELYSYATADLRGGKLYYMDENGYLTTGWKQISDFWYWFDSSGIKVNNCWMQDTVGWCYLGSTGNILVNTWQEDSTGKCYLDSNGRMLTNSWINIQNAWYYVDAYGHQVTGWQQIDGLWYHFDSFGIMGKNCWAFDNGTSVKRLIGATKTERIAHDLCYYLDSSGAMATGWKQIDGIWFWFHPSGIMAKNAWVRDSVGWCYLGKDGGMLTDCWKEDSVGKCYIGTSGYILTNSWVQYRSAWYYMDANGYVTTDWQMIDGQWYYFYSSGIMAANTQMSGGWIGENGIWMPY